MLNISGIFIILTIFVLQVQIDIISYDADFFGANLFIDSMLPF